MDFAINAETDLIAAGATFASNAYTLTADGTYCFGAVTLATPRHIIVPDGRKVVIQGHGTQSLVQGNVDNGAIFVFQGQATVHMHDIKLKNNSAVAGSRAIESSTTEAYLRDMAIIANDAGEGLRMVGGRLFATQLRISNVVTGVSCRGGEIFLLNYDCENLTNGISVDAAHSGLQWIGGRINDYVVGVQFTNACQSVVLQGVTAVSSPDSFVKRTGGTINRATIMGNTVAVTANGISWAAASIPTLGLTIVGNTFNVTTPLSGFSRSDARVNSKANVGPAGLLAETALVP